MSRLPHIIWDMGGIFFPYFTERMLVIGTERGWPLDRMPLGPTGQVHDADYWRMLEGELTEPEYLVIVGRRLQAEGIDFDPAPALAGTWVWRPETRQAVDVISHRGHRQALLTNDATRWLGEEWWEHWEERNAFEVILDVVRIGVRKPAPEPYLAAAEALGEPPGDCLFVDDLPVNCRGAEAVGMDSHLFDVTEPRASLDSLLARLQGTPGG